ncbi:MAG: radical SAM protein [Candidatus Omnitrophica bacterium]|nr:radical SAM protein [Candidatus Omnitrophota bacterium]MBU1925745.1 radical SAM protein [Candidatus Omnitrophota bacterium]
MKDISYKRFNLNIRKKGWSLNRPKVCQFELTFKCDLRCNYCYVDCYNNPAYIKKELNTQQVKNIIDKIYAAGVLWLYFSGGDPLTRPDFLELYSYAKEKGFIIALFTNGYSISKGVAGYLSKKPPAKIEITLNAADEALYEKISQVRGSFAKVMRGIDMMLKAKLPLKIKTQLTRDNLEEANNIKRFVEKLGLGFWPSFGISPRLNGDFSACGLRVSPDEVLRIPGVKILLKEEILRAKPSLCQCLLEKKDCVHLDPYGNTFSCTTVRKPSFSLLRVDIETAQKKLLSLARVWESAAFSKCKSCGLRKLCAFCPGMAYLEKGTMKEVIPYYCELAKATKRQMCGKT